MEANTPVMPSDPPAQPTIVDPPLEPGRVRRPGEPPELPTAGGREGEAAGDVSDEAQATEPTKE